jgi:N-formylmaleamate deformylase
MRDWPEGDIESAGITLHYYRTGGAHLPKMVLVHGFTDNGLCWSRFTRAFESHFDVVMLDARNHGKSGLGCSDLDLLAADLAAVILALDLAPAVVIGHSVGASVAAATAAQYPQLASRLILEDPPWTATTKPNAASASRREGFRTWVTSIMSMSEAQIAEQGRAMHPTWHDDELAPWAVSKRQVSPDAMEQLNLGDWTPAVSQLQCPTLLVYTDGSLDGLVSDATATKVTGLNPHVRVARIEGAGHNLRREQFAAYVEAIERFLF